MFALENNSQFNCEHCQWGEHCDKSNPAPTDIFIINKRVRDSKGEERDGKVIQHQDTCFKSDRSAATDQWYEAYLAYRDNNLNRDYFELPNYFLEVMKVHQYYENL